MSTKKAAPKKAKHATETVAAPVVTPVVVRAPEIDQNPTQVAPVIVQRVSKAFDIAAKIAEGFRFIKDAAGWNVHSPEGLHGHGPTPADAHANIGAVIVPNNDGERVLTRTDGTTITLDAPAA